MTGSRRQVEFFIQGKQPKEVTVLTRRGTGAHIPHLSTVVLALKSQRGNQLLLGDIFCSGSETRRNVVNHPMRKSTGSGSVRVVRDKNK